MIVGIVGHEAAKFTLETEAAARFIIGSIVWRPGSVEKGIDTERVARVVSGGCHLGGVDIWAEEIAKSFGIPTTIHLPESRMWTPGYKERNLLIARSSDVVHVIVVEKYPDSFTGTRYDLCYHCKTTEHVKSGACWTARQALHMGKRAVWHVV